MAAGLALPGEDVLTEGGPEIRAFKIVGRQSVSRQDRVDVAGLDELRECPSAVPVEDQGGSHDPYDAAVVPVVAQDVEELGVIPREGGLPGASPSEGEHVGVARLGGKTIRMDVDPLFAVLGPSHDDRIAFFKEPELPDRDASALIDRDAVHAALLRQQPSSFYLKVLGEDAHGVEALGSGSLRRSGLDDRVGGCGELLQTKVGCGVSFRCPAHTNSLSAR